MTESNSSSVHKIHEFDVCTFAPATEVTGKSIFELEDVIEENSMTIYVRTISGKTISIKCDKKQKAATMMEKVERRSSIPRGMMYLAHRVLNGKKTTEENKIGTETTIEMSLRLQERADGHT